MEWSSARTIRWCAGCGPCVGFEQPRANQSINPRAPDTGGDFVVGEMAGAQGFEPWALGFGFASQQSTTVGGSRFRIRAVGQSLLHQRVGFYGLVLHVIRTAVAAFVMTRPTSLWRMAKYTDEGPPQAKVFDRSHAVRNLSDSEVPARGSLPAA